MSPSHVTLMHRPSTQATRCLWRATTDVAMAQACECGAVAQPSTGDELVRELAQEKLQELATARTAANAATASSSVASVAAELVCITRKTMRENLWVRDWELWRWRGRSARGSKDARARPRARVCIRARVRRVRTAS